MNGGIIYGIDKFTLIFSASSRRRAITAPFTRYAVGSPAKLFSRQVTRVPLIKPSSFSLFAIIPVDLCPFIIQLSPSFSALRLISEIFITPFFFTIIFHSKKFRDNHGLNESSYTLNSVIIPEMFPVILTADILPFSTSPNVTRSPRSSPI